MSDTNPNPSPTIHDPAYWDALEDRIYPQYEQFNGKPYSELTDDERTDILSIVAHHVSALHVVLRALATESHPKRAHGRKPRPVDHGNEA